WNSDESSVRVDGLHRLASVVVFARHHRLRADLVGEPRPAQSHRDVPAPGHGTGAGPGAPPPAAVEDGRARSVSADRLAGHPVRAARDPAERRAIAVLGARAGFAGAI